MKTGATIAILIASITLARADPRRFTGTYRNPALGYSIKVPPGLQGETGDQAGPERGFGISLPSGGILSVYGEPNSIEWKDANEGVRWALADEKCRSTRQEQVSPARVGRLMGTKGSLECDGRVVETLLIFRPGGEPIYSLTLRTDPSHAREDQIILERFAASFKLIRWQ